MENGFSSYIGFKSDKNRSEYSWQPEECCVFTIYPDFPKDNQFSLAIPGTFSPTKSCLFLTLYGPLRDVIGCAEYFYKSRKNL